MQPTALGGIMSAAADAGSVSRTMTDDTKSYTKIVLRHVGQDGTVDVETPWARCVGPDLYELDNLPWYAYRVSVGDIVEARMGADGLPEFVRTVRKSGNRTIRVILKPPVHDSAESMNVLEHLRSMGCGYEGMKGSYFAVNIPADVDLEEIREFLIQSGQTWEHADPAYEDLFPEDGAG